MERQRILRYLPENYQLAATDERGLLAGLLAVMEEMHAPVELVLRCLGAFFDPLRAPEPFVLMQASWLGLDRYFEWSGGRVGAGEARFPSGTERLRLLLAEFPALVRSRGTNHSLARFLDLATGVPGFRVSDGMASGGAFHIVVHVPSAAAPLIGFVETIVAGERPAHATWELRPSDNRDSEED